MDKTDLNYLKDQDFEQIESLGLSIKELGDLLFEFEHKEFYREKPVDIETFLYDKDFLGSIYQDKNGIPNFYPFWAEHLKIIHATPFHKPIFEVFAMLPIGAGKTSGATASLIYEIYKLACLKDPRKIYPLDPGSTIVFCLFSQSRSLSESVNWKKIEGIFDNAPWFRRNLPLPEIGRIKRSGEVPLSRNSMSIDLGSQSAHALGKAVFGGVIDEAEFQKKASQQAKNTYDAIISRMSSRFAGRGGHLPGILWTISSPKDDTGFLIEKMENAHTSSQAYVIQNNPIWEIKKHIPGLYDKKKFSVFVGDEYRDPKILKEDESKEKYDSNRIFEVPYSNFYLKFESDLMTAIKDIIGWAATRSSKLFRSPKRIHQVMSLKNIFERDIIKLDFEQNSETLLDFLNTKYFNSPNHPFAYRYIHIDIGLTQDRLGIAATYAIPEKKLVFQEDGDWEKIKIVDRLYYVDWMIGIQAIEGQEIPLHKIQDFVSYLCKKPNYLIGGISADEYQSKHMLQNFRIQGIETKHVSVDRERHPYLSLKNLINYEKILMPKNSEVFLELTELIDDGKKIDHPKNFGSGGRGYKDIADGLSGSAWYAKISDKVIHPQKYIEHTNSPEERFKLKIRSKSNKMIYEKLANQFTPAI